MSQGFKVLRSDALSVVTIAILGFEPITRSMQIMYYKP